MEEGREGRDGCCCWCWSWWWLMVVMMVVVLKVVEQVSETYLSYTRI